MRFALSRELEMLRKAVLEFATRKIAPCDGEWDGYYCFSRKGATKPMGDTDPWGSRTANRQCTNRSGG